MPVRSAIAFQSCADVPALGDAEIHVWSACVEGASPRAIAKAAHALLERLLRGYTPDGTVPRIERGPHGKPFAPDWPDLEFNLSHAGPQVLLAFARRQALGVDIEAETRRFSAGLARRFFAPRETAALERLPEPLRHTAFLHLWTHKEALLKALGVGLHFGLDRIEFALDENGSVSSLHNCAPAAGHVDTWRFQRLAPGPGLIAALAWQGAARPVRALAVNAAFSTP
ncbi:MAG: 4'-phosphopantetheinyl transferase superfamily protein [Rhodanobacter sp.]|nr:4'-phosphopantetheinyl transferase superfamily protein [Rhodanobacter sp.]